MKTLLLCLALFATGASAGGQTDDETNPFGIPTDLLPFWERYLEAQGVDDDAGMASVVRENKEAAEITLNWILEGLSHEEDYERQSAARELAWTMDDVEHTERFIERVRFVIDLDMKLRKLRTAAMARFSKAMDAERAAEELDNPEGWAAAGGAYQDALEALAGVGDAEFQIFCLSRLDRIEEERGRPGRRAQWLEQLVALGDQVHYEEPLIASSQALLDAVLADAARSGSELAVEMDKGSTINDFAEGSEWQVFPVVRNVPKKGFSGYDLPVFAPFDQHLLWRWTEVLGSGPADFDSHRGVVLQPSTKRWLLGRDGTAKFTIDTDNDLEPDYEFTPSSSPQLIEVPDPEGGEPYPLWVRVGGSSETVFGVQVNHAPGDQAAMLRFFPAYWVEGEVLGETWRIMDLNLDNVLGRFTEFGGDFVTNPADDDFLVYGEADALIIGKSKRGVPFSSIHQIGDSWYRVEATHEDVRLRELNLATGTVELDIDLKAMPDFLVVVERSGNLPGAVFDILPAKKGRAVTLPVGEYEILQGGISSGKKTGMDTIRIYMGKAEPFKVYEDTPTKLALGGPFTIDFRVRNEGENFIVECETMRVFGQGGEEYARIYDDPLLPVISIQTTDGKTVEKSIKTRRPNVSDWLEGGGDHVLYFPLRHTVVNVSGDTWQAKMTVKAHKLLGGPFESDWIQ